MKSTDVERILKQVFRNYKSPNGSGMYVREYEIKAVIQAAVDLGIVELKEGPTVLPYSVQ